MRPLSGSVERPRRDRFAAAGGIGVSETPTLATFGASGRLKSIFVANI
jgi:hypothetical protein